MANEEHLAILKQGVEAWNEWREADPVMVPDLSNANLEKNHLRKANLYGANLEKVNLNRANLRGADLTGADLSGANLTGIILLFTDLKAANLTGADLRGADLTQANLFYANLSHADLSHATLLATQALGTNFSDATLTGACIQDWNINDHTNLDNAVCEYVYLKHDEVEIFEKIKTEFQERRPHTGNFAPGEFAKLVQQSFNTIDLIFREGLDWKAFAYSFKQVEVLHGDAHLEVRSIENKGDGVVIVKLAAAPDADKALIHNEFMKGYELATKAIAAQYEARLVDKDQHINQLFTLLQSSQERLGEVPKLIADIKGGDNYYGDIKAVNFTPRGTATGGVYNDFSNTQDLAQAASQIQALLAQLQQQGHSPEDAQQQVANDLAEQAKQDPTTLGKLVMWGQKLGDATVTDVVKGVVKMALRAAGVPLP